MLAVVVTIALAVMGGRYKIFQGMDVFGLPPNAIIAVRVSIFSALLTYYNVSFRRGASLTPSTILFFAHFVILGAVDWMAFVNALPDSMLIPNLTCLVRMALAGLVFWIWIEDQLENSFTGAKAHLSPGR